MMAVLTLDGFVALVEYDAEDEIFHAHTINGSVPIYFKGSSVDELKSDFSRELNKRKAFDTDQGNDVENPLSGNFSIRLKADTYVDLMRAASLSHMTLAELEALQSTDSILEDLAQFRASNKPAPLGQIPDLPPKPESENAAAEWGLPDWRDPLAYGDTLAWSTSRWRWEFLRRRQDYRNDFDRHAEDTYRHYLNYYAGDRDEITDGEILRPTDPGFRASMPGTPKYGLTGLLNPRISEQPGHELYFREYDMAFYRGRGPEFLEGGKPENVMLPAGRFVVRFDLTRPLAAQLEAAKSQLIYEQMAMFGKELGTKKHGKKWLLYLRVLDAWECGAHWSEIAAIMPETTKRNIDTARDTYKQAYDQGFKF